MNTQTTESVVSISEGYELTTLPNGSNSQQITVIGPTMATQKSKTQSYDFFKIIRNGAQQFVSEIHIWIFLTVLAFSVGSISYAQDILIRYIFQGRSKMLLALTASPLAIKILCYIVYNLLFVMVSCSLVILFSSKAEGSGISVLRALLNDCKDTPKSFLTFRTLVIKCIALPLNVGGMIFLGKTGPMVHISAACANVLLRSRIFKGLVPNRALFMSLLQMSCAVGIAANFQAPIAGVLLSVEIMTYFNYKIYIKTFYVSILTTVIVKIYQAIFNQQPYLTSVWKTGFFRFEVAYEALEVIFFILLGVIIGILAPLYSFCTEQLFQLKQSLGRKRFLFFTVKLPHRWDWLLKFTENRFYYTLLVSVLTSIVCMPLLIGPFMNLNVSQTLEDLFFVRDLTIIPGAKENPTVSWAHPTEARIVFQNLLAFCVFRILISLFSFPISCPGGLFVPSVVIGAGIGRLFGEVLHYIVYPYLDVNAGGYAIVGAAVFSACYLQAFSCIFIILEIVGNSFYVPSLIAGIVGMIIARHLGISVYDSIARVQKLKFLSEIRADHHIETQGVTRFMKSCAKWMLLDKMTIGELEAILNLIDKEPGVTNLPVVLSYENPILLGDVSKEQLIDVIVKTKASLSENSVSMMAQESIYISFKSVTSTLDEQSNFATAHQLFSMSHVDQVYVCARGKLMGYVSRKDLIVLNNEFRPTIYELISEVLDQKIFKYA